QHAAEGDTGRAPRAPAELRLQSPEWCKRPAADEHSSAPVRQVNREGAGLAAVIRFGDRWFRPDGGDVRHRTHGFSREPDKPLRRHTDSGLSLILDGTPFAEFHRFPIDAAGEWCETPRAKGRTQHAEPLPG